MALSQVDLANEINNDPTNLGLKNLFDTHQADDLVILLNKKGNQFSPPKTDANFTMRDGEISPGEFVRWAAGGPRLKLEQAAAAGSNNTLVRALSLTFLDSLRNGGQPGLDIDKIPITALNAMRTAPTGAFDQTEQDALIALGNVSVSRAEKLAGIIGYKVTLDHIAKLYNT